MALTDTLGADQRQQRAAVNLLPAGYLARAGAAELSAAELQLVQDFRQLGNAGRDTMERMMHKVADRERVQRITANAAKLHLVSGGAA